MVLIEQISALIDFLENHQDLALGHCSRTNEGRSLSKRYWMECAPILNSISMDCPNKTPAEWRTFYNEYKSKLLKKIKLQKSEVSVTGGGPAKKITLTPLQERLYTILERDVGEPLPGVRHNPFSEDLSEIDKKVLAIIGETAVCGDSEHRVPVFNIQPEAARGPVQPEDIVVSEEVVISDTEFPEDVASPSPVQIQALEPEPHQTDDVVGQPARDHPYQQHRASLPTSQTRIDPEWVMPLERSRVQAENKLADAAVMIAEATKVIAQASLIHAETSRKQSEMISTLVEVVREKNNVSAASSVQCGGSMPAVDKKEIKVFCPKCKTKVLHNVEGMQKDETSKIIIANVYHYLEQEYEELTKTYEGMDLTPLSKFSERTALATGVSESTVLEILQERARRNADVPQKPARKRPRQPESSSEGDSCGGDEDDGEHSTTEHVDEPEVYVQLAGVKTEPDACGDDRELADPISVHVKIEPQNERDATCSEAVAVQSAAKRRKGSIKQRHAEAPAASCGAPSGHSDCETVAALSAAKRDKGSIKQRHAEAPAASCGAPSGQLPLPPDQQLTLHNPLTNQQGFS